MHLLNVRTRQLEHFPDPPPPPYAILSHLWTAGDAHRFHEIGTPGIDNSPSYHKVDMCCKLALEGGLDYVWIDTCCADANSSSVFTEVLNSAYAWFQGAEVCYVYLDDVDGAESPEKEESTFRLCKWFKRAWTLQELLAPTNLVFFSKDWSNIGTKDDLAVVISEVTGIHRDAILYPDRVHRFSIAARMSWASGRKSSKSEDRVYSLLGLFGVNLPIVYGEGEKETFVKLQHKIIETSDDQSIFAWRSVLNPSSFPTTPFADSPDCFADCGDVHPIPHSQWLEHCTMHFRSSSGVSPCSGFSKSNAGLHLSLPLRLRDVALFDGILACGRGECIWNGERYVVDLQGAELVHICLRNCASAIHRYDRVVSDCLGTISIHDAKDFALHEVCIAASQQAPIPLEATVAPTFVIRYGAAQTAGFVPALHSELPWVFDPDSNAAERQVLLRPDKGGLQSLESPDFGRVGRIEFSHPSVGDSFVVELGLDSKPTGKPWVHVSASGRQPGEDEFKDLAIWQLKTGQVVMVTLQSLSKDVGYEIGVTLSPMS